jgi:hypothetical protein
MLRRLFSLVGVMAILLSLTSASAHGDVIAWRASSTNADALHAQLRIDARVVDLDFQTIKPAAPQHNASLLIETGNSNALVPVAIARKMTMATINLSHLSDTLRGPALRDLIGKLKKESDATRVLAHGDTATSPTLIANAALFDGLLVENISPPSSLKAPRLIALMDGDGLTKTLSVMNPGGTSPTNHRRFYLTTTPLASMGADASCKSAIYSGSADPARRALLVMLEDWLRGLQPPPSRFPGVSDLAPAHLLVWPKIPNLPPPVADDRERVRIDVDGNETSGLRMPDRLMPVATFVNVDAHDDKTVKPCHGVMVLPFAATRAARDANHDPRQSLVERYGSRAYFVATLRVIADKLVREKLLLPQDADAYVAAGKSAPF